MAVKRTPFERRYYESTGRDLSSVKKRNKGSGGRASGGGGSGSSPRPTPAEEAAQQSLINRGQGPSPKPTPAEQAAQQSLMDRGSGSSPRPTPAEEAAQQSLINRSESISQQRDIVRSTTQQEKEYSPTRGGEIRAAYPTTSSRVKSVVSSFFGGYTQDPQSVQDVQYGSGSPTIQGKIERAAAGTGVVVGIASSKFVPDKLLASRAAAGKRFAQTGIGRTIASSKWLTAGAKATEGAILFPFVYEGTRAGVRRTYGDPGSQAELRQLEAAGAIDRENLVRVARTAEKKAVTQLSGQGIPGTGMTLEQGKQLLQDKQRELRAQGLEGADLQRALDAESAKIRYQAQINPYAILYELPGQIAPRRAKDFAQSEVEARLVQQGVSASRAKQLATEIMKERTGERSGEVVGTLLAVERIGESSGRKIASRAFSDAARSGAKVAAKDAPRVAGRLAGKSAGAAGFFEGPLNLLTQRKVREEELAPNVEVFGKKLPRGVDYAGAGVLGYGTSRFFSGTITRLSVAKRPSAAKAVSGVANIMDPLEYFGDISQDTAESIVRQTGGRVPGAPFVRVSSPALSSATFGVSAQSNLAETTGTSTTATTSSKKKSATTTKPSQQSYLDSLIADETRADIMPRRKNIVPSENVPVQPITKIDVPSIADVPTDTPVAVEQRQKTETVTNVPSITSVPVPTLTPLLRIPPPMPLPGLGSGGGITGGRGGRSRVFNELQAGLSLLVAPASLYPAQARAGGSSTKKPGAKKQNRTKKKQKSAPRRSQLIVPNIGVPLFSFDPFKLPRR